MARCETGNKCISQIDSPSGKYQGPFQFSPATWKSQCVPIFSKRHIDECSGKDKIRELCCASMCAAEMIANGGSFNWPRCGASVPE